MAQSHGTVPPLRVERWTRIHDSTLLEAHTCFLNHLGNQAHFGKWMKMDIHSDPSTSIHIHFGFVDFGGCGCGSIHIPSISITARYRSFVEGSIVWVFPFFRCNTISLSVSFFGALSDVKCISAYLLGANTEAALAAQPSILWWILSSFLQFSSVLLLQVRMPISSMYPFVRVFSSSLFSSRIVAL